MKSRVVGIVSTIIFASLVILGLVGLKSPAITIFGTLFAIAGLVVIVSVGQEFRHIGRLRGKGVGTTGTVVKHVSQANGLDQAVIQFIDQQGCEFELTPSLQNRFVPVGEQFPVVYLPDQPQKARIRSRLKRRLLLPVLICGLLFLALGILTAVAGVLPQVRRVPNLNFGEPATVLVYFLGLAGSLFPLVYCGWKVRYLFILHRNGLKTTGTVTRTVKGDDGAELSVGPFSLSREGKHRKPVIDFFDSKNRRIQFIGDRGPSSIGARVAVVYLPDQPHNAVVAPPLRNVKSLVFPILVGFLLTAVTVGFAGKIL